MMTGSDRPMVLAALVEAYSALRAALTTALSDRECARDAPYMDWRGPDWGQRVPTPWEIGVVDGHLTRPPEESRHVLVQAGEVAGATAANTLRGHLALLERAYWPDINDPADDVIQFPAIYPPARAVLETVAEVGWLFDPDIGSGARTQRAAELLLWSQVTRRQPEAGWHDVARAAGLDVRSTRKRPDAYYVWTGEGSSALTMSRMVRTTLGDEFADLYNAWSGSTHPDPITLTVRSVLTLRPGGYGVGGLVREDEDVAVAANVAELLAFAIERQAVYWGRSPGPAEDCFAVAGELREFLPVVTEEVNVRNARAD